MGLTGYRIQIDLGILFRKMYCCKCGERLKKHSISRIIKKGDYDFDTQLVGQKTSIGMDKIKETTYIYKCNSCCYTIDYDYQKRIAKKQKSLKRKNLTATEIASLKVYLKDYYPVEEQETENS